MCGITALLGKSCSNVLIDSLKQLQNRGYDSAGISTINTKNTFIIDKYASTDSKSAIDLLEENLDIHKDNFNGIAHTRWATHGPKNDVNSHPHISMNNTFSIVHNGIIENYKQLKNSLLENDYKFKSLTDSEVISNLLDYEFKKLDKNYNEESIINIIKTVSSLLEGTWALAIQFIHCPNKIYCTRRGSPILVSYNDDFAMIVSEQSGFNGNFDNYIILDNDDICEIEKKETIIIKTEKIYKNKKVYKQDNNLTPYPYPHWTIKEINEQVDSSLRAISLGGRLLSTDMVKLGGIESKKDVLKDIDNLILLGCGTSYYAGLLGVNYFKDLCELNTVQVFDGAEFTFKDVPKKGKTALILLSQSGETKDLYRCIKIGKDNNLFLIGIVNVPDSMIAREVYCGCYLNAGREIAVGSTKSFTSQVILLSMMAIWFSQIKNLNISKRQEYIINLRRLYIDIQQSIKICDREVDKYLKFFDNKSSCFILGKAGCEAISKEGALKIKELSYIHAEGYSSSSLKHGPFALLEPEFPVIILAPNNDHYSKVINAYEEVKSRHANVILITNNQDCDKENTIILPKNICYDDLLNIIPLQLFAYKLSIRKNINPDIPKNLAKVVTVD